MGDAEIMEKLGDGVGKLAKTWIFFVYFNLILYATWTKIEDDWG